jgi:hypothetical protein
MGPNTSKNTSETYPFAQRDLHACISAKQLPEQLPEPANHSGGKEKSEKDGKGSARDGGVKKEESGWSIEGRGGKPDWFLFIPSLT